MWGGGSTISIFETLVILFVSASSIAIRIAPRCGPNICGGYRTAARRAQMAESTVSKLRNASRNAACEIRPPWSLALATMRPPPLFQSTSDIPATVFVSDNGYARTQGCILTPFLSTPFEAWALNPFSLFTFFLTNLVFQLFGAFFREGVRIELHMHFGFFVRPNSGQLPLRPMSH